MAIVRTGILCRTRRVVRRLTTRLAATVVVAASVEAVRLVAAVAAEAAVSEEEDNSIETIENQNKATSDRQA